MVQIVRRAYEAFNARDAEELKALVAPDFVLRASAATDGKEHHGPHAMDEILEAIAERWEDFRLEPLEFYTASDRVLVLGTLVTKGRDQEGLASIAAQVWTVRDDQIVSMEAFLDSDEAIRAGGFTRLLS